MRKVSMWVVMVAGLTPFTGCGDEAKPAADTAPDTPRADTAGTDEQDGAPYDAVETAEDTEPPAPDAVDDADTAPETVADTEADLADTASEVADTGPDTDTVAPVCSDLRAVLSDDELAFLQGAYPSFEFGTGGDLGFGGPETDRIVLMFLGLELGTSDTLVGTFHYGVEQNANLATASEVFLLVEDEGARLYFGRAGTVTVDEPPGLAQHFEARIADLEIEEITVDPETGWSTPVEGGACFQADELVLTQPCTPVCRDHVCGPDGCGGECPGAVCAETARCLLDGSGCGPKASCESLAWPSLVAPTDPHEFEARMSLFLGEVSGADRLTLRLVGDPTEGVALDLGAGPNTSWATCTECLRLDVDGRTTLFQSAGALTVNSPTDLESGAADVTLVGVKLSEVTIGEDGTTTPVDGGRCIDLEPARLSTSFPAPQLLESDGWLVSAETPVVSGDTVQGAFIFTRMSGAETRGGGACLVADLNQAAPCADSADCDATLPPLGTGGAYYCSAVNGQGPKRCWTRPSDNCSRNPSRAPGYYTTLPEPALLDGQPTLWATYACMADETLGTGCATSDPTLYVSTTGPTLRTSP